jgi:hypothetical protein
MGAQLPVPGALTPFGWASCTARTWQRFPTPEEVIGCTDRGLAGCRVTGARWRFTGCGDSPAARSVWAYSRIGKSSYTNLGADYYTQRDDPEARKNRLLRQLHDLGYHAELSPMAA